MHQFWPIAHVILINSWQSIPLLRLLPTLCLFEWIKYMLYVVPIQGLAVVPKREFKYRFQPFHFRLRKADLE